MDVKSQAQSNTVGAFGSPFIDPSSFAGLRPPASVPMSVPSLSTAPTLPVFVQPYLMPFIAPSVSNAPTAGISQSPSTPKHKIHDLKASSSGIISSHSKESSTVQPSSVVASPSSRPLSRGAPGNMLATKQVVHPQSVNQSVSSGNSFTALQSLASGGSDRTPNAQSSALNFMQQQQQQQQVKVLLGWTP
ncbi:unnamed protein product [Gongylonema pulchrum]|uniref:Transcription factor n=1 Tax=Gongylonema pulchrum TaxID=637853 RepID=A0A183EAB1_9BILA|nr:unnamed protein product [Gongylonema pulchrum]